MDNVEIALTDPRSNAPRRFHAETQTGNRTVVGNRDRSTSVGNPFRQIVVIFGWGKNIHVVAT